jgi:1,2-diacylglycerol 3-beta-galactosyltransferase
VKPSQIVQYGLPIRKGFWKQSHGDAIPDTTANDRETIRQALGIDLKLPTVLVVGGGDGMGGIVDIAISLGEKLGDGSDSPAYQMIVVCGNNKVAKEALLENEWGNGVKVEIQGFVDNMDEWMRASDALVTKAGPGTIAEASICGLPCMLFSFL